MMVWVEAARPRTLPLSIGPVVVGTAAAGTFHLTRLLPALVVSMGLQIGVNLANDFFDAQKGVDTPDRVGPRRLTAAGLVTPARIKRAIAVVLAVTMAAGTFLAVMVGPELLLVGLACLIATLAYSGGPKPYASAGLGELFVFVFFGLVATAGSAYVQTEVLRTLHVVAGIPVGLLACLVLLVNNLRDIPTDSKAGKKTLAVRLGRQRTINAYLLLLVLAFASLGVVALLDESFWPLLPVMTLGLAWQPATTIRKHRAPSDLGPALGSTVRLYTAFTVLLAAGLALG